MKIGLRPDAVALVPYRKVWKRAFEAEKKRLETVLKKAHIAHIGSTAIPGISAKPIIDILVGVPSMQDSRRIVVLLTRAGYLKIRLGNPRRWLFFAKGDSNWGTHHLHVVKYGGRLWEAHTAFPRYLRENSNPRNSYNRLKQQLARKFKNDRRSYTRAKGSFILKTAKKAVKYYAHRNKNN